MIPAFKRLMYGAPEDPQPSGSKQAMEEVRTSGNRLNRDSGKDPDIRGNGVHLHVTRSTIDISGQDQATSPSGKTNGAASSSSKGHCRRWTTGPQCSHRKGGGGRGIIEITGPDLEMRESRASLDIDRHTKMNLKCVAYNVGKLRATGQYMASLILLLLNIEWKGLPDFVTLTAITRVLTGEGGYYWKRSKHAGLYEALEFLRTYSLRIKGTNGKYFLDMFGQDKLNRFYRRLGIRPAYRVEYSVGEACARAEFEFNGTTGGITPSSHGSSVSIPSAPPLSMDTPPHMRDRRILHLDGHLRDQESIYNDIQLNPRQANPQVAGPAPGHRDDWNHGRRYLVEDLAAPPGLPGFPPSFGAK